MAIKTMDASMFDKIAGTTPKEKDNYIPQNDMQYLYEKGLEELQEMNETLNIFVNYMSELFCGGTLLSTEEARNFVLAMEMFTNQLIPSILSGDMEETYKYCNEDMTEEELEQARIEFFTMLYKKYLER